MTFTINGLNIVPYIGLQGLKWTRNDLDGPNTGRTMDGTMWRDRITTKYKFDITCKPLTREEAAQVLSSIQNEYFTVTCTDPVTNSNKTFEVYSNNIPADYLMKTVDGVEYWEGIKFPVIER